DPIAAGPWAVLRRPTVRPTYRLPGCAWREAADRGAPGRPTAARPGSRPLRSPAGATPPHSRDSRGRTGGRTGPRFGALGAPGTAWLCEIGSAPSSGIPPTGFEPVPPA